MFLSLKELLCLSGSFGFSIMECLLTVVVEEINLNLGVFGTLKNMCEKCFYIFFGVVVVHNGRR